MENKIPTYEMKRVLPEDVHVVKNINGIDIYNLTIFKNIMSWNQYNLQIPAIEYCGNQITYGELPQNVELYAAGLDSLGVKKDSKITLSLPVSVENLFTLFATSEMGAISNNVNLLFLKRDLKKYTTEKDSDTLFILDLYLPFFSDQIKKTGIKKIVLTSLNDYLPADKKDFFADINKFPKALREKVEDKSVLDRCMSDIRNLKGVEFIQMADVLKEGKKRIGTISFPKVDVEKDSIYSYTSGTTGEPKCFVFKEQAPNAIIEMHKGLDLDEYVGDRSLVVIPTSHATGMFYATYLQLAKGKTLVLQPLYDKNTFAQDLQDLKINHTLAAGSFYAASVGKKVDLSNLTRACSGGEAITKSNVYSINNWLEECHSPVPKIAIGGGAGEVGSSALTSYELDSKTKTNETGYPIPGVYVKIVDKNGKQVKKGQRGYLEISSAAAADRYLENKEATDDYFYYDNAGHKWARLRDITVQNYNGSYSMLGRSSDSYITKDGQVRYLFDIEYSLDNNDPISEWEISSFKLPNGETKVVAQIVLKDGFDGDKKEFVTYICNKYKVDAVKFYDSFGVSEVTGKRDYLFLQHDRKDYFVPTENGITTITFEEEQSPKLNDKIKKIC